MSRELIGDELKCVTYTALIKKIKGVEIRSMMSVLPSKLVSHDQNVRMIESCSFVNIFARLLNSTF